MSRLNAYQYWIRLAEWLIIALMALAGVLALANSSAYSWIYDPVAGRWPAFAPFLPGLIWALVFIFGVQSVILRSKGGGALAILVGLISLPALMSFNSVDWLEFIAIQSHNTFEPGFFPGLVLGLLIMTGYLLLNLMSTLKQSRLSFKRCGANPADIQGFDISGHSVAFLGIGVSLAAAIAIYSLSRGTEALSAGFISAVPWYILLIGFGCIFILAVYLYWLGMRKTTGE
jgi:hypothetical protein